MPDEGSALTSYLRTFSLWAKNGLSGKFDINSSAPAHLLQGHDAPPRTVPNVYKFQVSQAGVASLTPVALGSSPSASTDPIPIFPEAPSDGSSYGRTDGGWTEVLPLAGGTMSGSIVLPGPPSAANEAASKDYVDSSVLAGGAAYLPLAGGTVTGPLTLAGLFTAATATFGGTVGLNGGLTFTALPPQAADDATAATAGVPIGGVYCNGSIMMMRQA